MHKKQVFGGKVSVVDTLTKYKKARKIFGIIFLISLPLTFFLIPALVFFSFGSAAKPSSKPILSSNTGYPTPLSSPTEYSTPNSPIDTDTPQSNTNRQQITKQPTEKSPVSNKNSSNQTSVKGNPTYQSNINVNELQSSQGRSSETSHSQQPVIIQSSSSDPTLLVTAMGISLFSSVTSMVGFLFTTIFVWRKGKVEKESLLLEKQKNILEMEKLRLELEQSKQSNSSEFKSCPLCKRTYSDSSLSFCIDDGAILSAPFNSNEFQKEFSEKTLTMESDILTVNESELPTKNIKIN